MSQSKIAVATEDTAYAARLVTVIDGVLAGTHSQEVTAGPTGISLLRHDCKKLIIGYAEALRALINGIARLAVRLVVLPACPLRVVIERLTDLTLRAHLGARLPIALATLTARGGLVAFMVDR